LTEYEHKKITDNLITAYHTVVLLYIQNVKENAILLLLLLLLLLTANELSLDGSNSYTSADKTNKNIIYINEAIQKHSTNSTKCSKYKYTYYQNTHTLQNPYIHTPTHFKTHTYTHPHTTKQVTTNTVQDISR